MESCNAASVGAGLKPAPNSDATSRVSGGHWHELDLCPQTHMDAHGLLTQWEMRRAGRLMPAWREFGWQAVPSHLLALCGLLEIRRQPFDAIYRFFGTGHVEALGQELTNRSIRDYAPETLREMYLDQYQVCAERGQPMLIHNVLAVLADGTELDELSLKLPFSDDGKTVTHIFAYTDNRLTFEATRRLFVNGQDAAARSRMATLR